MTGIISYDKADIKLKAEMDSVMEPVLSKSDSFEAICNYGKSPLGKYVEFGTPYGAVLEEYAGLRESFIKTIPAFMSGLHMEKFNTVANNFLSVASPLVKKAEALDLKNAEIRHELGIYLGASQQILNWYEKGFIPYERKVFEASNKDIEDEIRLKRVIGNKESFTTQIEVLKATYNFCLRLSETVSSMRDDIKMVTDMKPLVTTQPKKNPGNGFTL